MVGYKTVQIEITEPQARKALRGKGFKLKPDQIGKGVLYLHPVNLKKVEKAMIKHKPIVLELSPAELAETALHHMRNMSGSGMQGGAFWSKIWEGLKKGWKFLKDSGIATKILDVGVPAVATALGAPEVAPAARNLAKNLTGAALKDKKNKELLKASGLYLS